MTPWVNWLWKYQNFLVLMWSGQDPFWYSQTIWNLYLSRSMGKWDYFLQDMEMLSLTLWIFVNECECWGNWQAAITGWAQVQSSRLWSSSCTRCSAKGLQPSPTTSLFFHYWDFPKHAEPKGHINTCLHARRHSMSQWPGNTLVI